MERDCTMDDFQKAGRRVEIHPCTDWWMMGARFGTVVRIDRAAGLFIGSQRDNMQDMHNKRRHPWSKK